MSFASDLDRTAAQLLATGGTPGLAIAVVHDGQIIFQKSYGVADRETGRQVRPDTRFYIASTTKSLTALAGVLLEARGSLNLDLTLDCALPGVELAAPLDPKEIKLRDLLTMTHGIASGPVDFRCAFTGQYSRALLLNLLRTHSPAKAGREFQYSNIGYVLFGLVLDFRFEAGWKSIVDVEVLQPLGMRQTTAFVSRVEASALAMPHELGPEGMERVYFAKNDMTLHPAGGHLSTAGDLARLLLAELNAGRIDGKQVLPASVIEATQSKQVPQNSRHGEYQRTGWALGWDIASYDGATLLSRFGGFSGYQSHVSFIPERRAGVVVLANGGEASNFLVGMLANYAYDRLAERADAEDKAAVRFAAYSRQLEKRRTAAEEDRARRMARPQTTALALSSYVGAFENPRFGRLELSYSQSQLIAEMGAARSAVEVYDGAKNQFRIDIGTGGQVIVFEVSDGHPTSVRFAGEVFKSL